MMKKVFLGLATSALIIACGTESNKSVDFSDPSLLSWDKLTDSTSCWIADNQASVGVASDAQLQAPEIGNIVSFTAYENAGFLKMSFGTFESGNKWTHLERNESGVAIGDLNESDDGITIGMFAPSERLGDLTGTLEGEMRKLEGTMSKNYLILKNIFWEGQTELSVVFRRTACQ